MTGKLNEAIEFQPIGIAVMTISDTRKKENDKSGDVLEQRLIDAGHKLISRTIVRDDIVEIDRKRTRLSLESTSYAVICLKQKKEVL